MDNTLVVAHEIGHSLGAALPDSNKEDNHSNQGLMVPSINNPNISTELDQKSVNEIVERGKGPEEHQKSWLDIILQLFL